MMAQSFVFIHKLHLFPTVLPFGYTDQPLRVSDHLSEGLSSKDFKHKDLTSLDEFEEAPSVPRSINNLW